MSLRNKNPCTSRSNPKCHYFCFLTLPPCPGGGYFPLIVTNKQCVWSCLGPLSVPTAAHGFCEDIDVNSRRGRILGFKTCTKSTLSPSHQWNIVQVLSLAHGAWSWVERLLWKQVTYSLSYFSFTKCWYQSFISKDFIFYKYEECSCWSTFFRIHHPKRLERISEPSGEGTSSVKVRDTYHAPEPPLSGVTSLSCRKTLRLRLS